MIRQIFLLAISLSFLFAKECIEYNAPNRFEEASDELIEFLDEYFSKKITFLPTFKDIKELNLIKKSTNIWELKNSSIYYNRLKFPIKKGIWKIELIAPKIYETHILLKEPNKLTQIEAFNTYNDLLGGYWRDYDLNAYKMSLMPQDISIAYKNRYFELNIIIYGTKDDASPLKQTNADIILRDLTSRVKEYQECKGLK